MSSISQDLADYIARRDKGCVLAMLVPGHHCRDRWGQPHLPDDLDKLTLEHVKDSARMGKRAESDAAHLVLVCHHSNAFSVETSKYRAEIRAYLDQHEPSRKGHQ